MLDLYRSGKPIKDIAADLHLSRHQVAQHLRQEGIKVRGVLWTDEEILEMKRRYEAGETLQEIADAFGATVPTVRQRIMAHGVRMRTTPESLLIAKRRRGADTGDVDHASDAA